jgi:hypothetical protein
MARKPIAKPRVAPTPPQSADDVEPQEMDEVQRLIAVAAYYRAEQRGFEPGHELDDWIAAEKEVRRRMEGRA